MGKTHRIQGLALPAEAARPQRGRSTALRGRRPEIIVVPPPHKNEDSKRRSDYWSLFKRGSHLRRPTLPVKPTLCLNNPSIVSIPASIMIAQGSSDFDLNIGIKKF